MRQRGQDVPGRDILRSRVALLSRRATGCHPKRTNLPLSFGRLVRNPGNSPDAASPIRRPPASDIPTDLRPVVLTGDRPTGPLFLGQFCGSQRDRVILWQGTIHSCRSPTHRGLTEKADDPERVTRDIIDLARDDPAVAAIRTSPRSTGHQPWRRRTPTPTTCASMILGGARAMWYSRSRHGHRAGGARSPRRSQRHRGEAAFGGRPARSARDAWAERQDDVHDILRNGTRRARGVTSARCDTIEDVLGLYHVAA